MKRKFVHLHNHTEYSLLDGCGKIADFIAYAGELGHTHFAVTEHGSMRSYYKLAIECKKHGGVKPIFGIEFYMSDDLNVKALPDDIKKRLAETCTKKDLRKAQFQEERRLGIRPKYHLCAFAKNNEGLKNLFRLSSLAWIDGFFHRPRIDKAALLRHKEGLMVSSACVAGTVPQLLLDGDFPGAVAEVDWWLDNFGDDFYLEVMPHSFDEQTILTPMMVKLAKSMGVKMIATNDCHYIRERNSLHQDILLCIQTNDRMSNPDRFQFDTKEFWMKTWGEMQDSFTGHHDISDADIKEALRNTLEIAEKAKAEIVLDKFRCLTPPIEIPADIESRSADEIEAQARYLQRLCVKGWDWRELDDQIAQKAQKLGIEESVHKQTYSDRLRLELKAMVKQKFSGYFILVHEMFEWAREKEIMVGPGRGSSAGSLVCYLLGITSLDPIEHGLLFERFMSPARIDMPDIDMDFEDRRREEIINYLKEKYGVDNVAQIGTVTAMKGKLCLRDVCRVMDVPSAEVGAVTNSIVERSSGDERASQTLEDSFKEFQVCREFNEKHPEILPIVKNLEGQARQTGIHAAGVLTSPVPIWEVVPVETKEVAGRGRIRVAAIDFWGCEDMGLLKLDVLGLRTLTVIKDTLRSVEARHGVEIDMERLAMDDPKVFDNFSQKNFAGVFQFDTTAMYKTCEQITFVGFQDIAAMTALNRPGTMRSGLATEYIERKNNPSKAVSIHPIYDEICKETEGVLVYQEQLTRIFVEMSGYEPATADSLRKLVAKKHGDELMGKERETFVKGAVERGVPADVANKLMNQMTFFGCLSRFSKISMISGTGEQFRRSIGILYDLQKNAKYRGKDNWNRRVLSVDLDSGELVENTIKTVFYNGEQRVYELSVYQDNKQKKRIEVTEGHHFYVKDRGWAQLSDLKVGDKIAVRYFPKVAEAKRAERWKGGISGTYSRQLGEKHYDLRCAICGWDIWIHFHHIDGDDKNNVVENLIPLCPNHHKAVHLGRSRINEKLRMTTLKNEIEIGPTKHFHYLPIRDIKCLRSYSVYDLEMEHEPYNYIADNFIVHNSYAFNKSHSCAYGAIAYWTMYLKTYYPTEFMCAVLKNEPAHTEVTRFIKETRNMGIEVLGPDMSYSGADFKISGEKIRCSLLDIKGVGAKAVGAIEKVQPFKSFGDLLERGDRRLIKKNVIQALVKAGATLEMLPNTRFFMMNHDELFKLADKGKFQEVDDLIENRKSDPDYDQTELALLAAEVSPLPLGQHPMEAYDDLMKEMGSHVRLARMDDDDLFKKKTAYVAGQIVDLRYNQVGDFHSGAKEPGEHEKKKMKWGARYSNFNVEDKSGKWQRVKMDVDAFPYFREVIDSGIGTPVIFRAALSVRGNWRTIKAYNLVNLFDLRGKIIAKEPLTFWEQYFIEHPVEKALAGEKAVKRTGRGRVCITGLIIHARHTIDKNGNEMAFFEVDYITRIDRVVCFASNYDRFKDKIKIGVIGKFELARQKGGLILDDDGKIEILEAHSMKDNI